MEVDITEKVTKGIKYALGLVIMLAILTAFFFLHPGAPRYLTLHDAKVAGAMVNVTAKAAGEITELPFAAEQEVAAGDIIAKLSVSITPEEIDQLSQTVELAKVNLAQVEKGQMVRVPLAGSADPEAQARVTEAEARAKRMEELFEMGAVSGAKRDEAKAALELARAAASLAKPSYTTTLQPSPPEVIEAAKLSVSQAEAALAAAQNDARATEVTSPVAGTLYPAENIALGSKVTAGETIAQVGEVQSLWVEVKIPLSDKDSVYLGQYAVSEIADAAYPGTVLDIKVPEGNDESEEAAFVTVKISLPGEAKDLKPGAEGTVKLSLK